MQVTLTVSRHENLKEILLVPKFRKSDPLAPVTAYEHKQLRALLGLFQWLVAQVRFDMAHRVLVAGRDSDRWHLNPC